MTAKRGRLARDRTVGNIAIDAVYDASADDIEAPGRLGGVTASAGGDRGDRVAVGGRDLITGVAIAQEVFVVTR